MFLEINSSLKSLSTAVKSFDKNAPHFRALPFRVTVKKFIKKCLKLFKV